VCQDVWWRGGVRERIRLRREYYSILPPSEKTCNYGLRVDKSSLHLIKFLVNTIHIYDFKLIY
jgi:hypothetical protein